MGNSPVVNRINALLAEKGIQKQDFYKNCGITSASYSLWNTGKTTPRMKNLETIADYLNTTTDYLLTGLGQKEKASAQEDERELDGLSDIYFSLAKDLQDAKIDPEDIRNFARIIAKNMQKE